MQRLIDAAKAAVSAIRKLDAFDDCVVVKSNLELAIYAAERQAADDAELITWDWLQSIGWMIEDQYINNVDIKRLHAGGARLYYEEVCRSSDGRHGPVEIHYELFFGREILPHIKTRGQLRDLIKALKGGGV